MVKRREVILDTETTGLSVDEGHRLIEIGAVEMINKVITGNKFQCYINPKRDVSRNAYMVHGISSEFLLDKPLFKDIVHDFLDFINDSTLVIHNAKFDVKFLNHELKILKLPIIDLDSVIDTVSLARKKFPGSRVNLDALCRRFKVDNSSRDFHGALKDAELLAKVYVELCGGRQCSFSIIYENDIVQDEDLEPLEVNNIVIFPTSEELEMHKDFLDVVYQNHISK